MSDNLKHVMGEPYELVCGEKTLKLGMLEPKDLLIVRRNWAREQIAKARLEEFEAVKEMVADLPADEKMQLLRDSLSGKSRRITEDEIDEFLLTDPSTFDYTLWQAARKYDPDLAFDDFVLLARQADGLDVTVAYLTVQGADIDRAELEKAMKESAEKEAKLQKEKDLGFEVASQDPPKPARSPKKRSSSTTSRSSRSNAATT